MEDIRVHVAGYLKRYMPEPALCAAVEWQGRPLSELLATLSIPHNVNYVIMVNGVRRGPTILLEAGDQVQLVPILGGG